MANEFFKDQDINSIIAMGHLSQFRRQSGLFQKNSWIWEHANNPVQFWQLIESFAPDLAKISERLSSCPYSSVTSERAFSILNLIHTKTRNRLKPERVNKLQYIYINERALARDLPELRTLNELDQLSNSLNNDPDEDLSDLNDDSDAIDDDNMESNT
jgi:hypothetical protein